MFKSSQIQFRSFTKFIISCFHYWQKPGTACQPSMTADAAIRIVWKPLQRGTLYPQDSIHLPGEIHGSSYTKVCGVQIIKQNLSLAHPSIGSFPRARDTEFPAPAPLVLPIPETGLVESTWSRSNRPWCPSMKIWYKASHTKINKLRIKPLPI
jgi:hypothetical protein